MHNYGARYYDPVLSRWISADPKKEDYLPNMLDKKQLEKDWKPERDLPGQGGIYSPINLGLYSYGGNNPLIYIDPDGNERAVFYDLDFKSQAAAQITEWSKQFPGETVKAFPVESIRDIKNAIEEINANPEGVNELVLMFHGDPSFVHIGGAEYLSANDESITPLGNPASPISGMPDINFNAGASIKANICRSGFPADAGGRLNVGLAFKNRYSNTTIYAYPYRIKYANENSPVVVPTTGSTFIYPRFGPVRY